MKHKIIDYTLTAFIVATMLAPMLGTRCDADSTAYKWSAAVMQYADECPYKERDLQDVTGAGRERR